MSVTEKKIPAVSEENGFIGALSSALAASPYRQVRNLTCESRGQAIVLKGTVSKYYLKQIAHALVQAQLPADVPLENHMEVQS